MEFLPKKYAQESTDLGSEKTLCNQVSLINLPKIQRITRVESEHTQAL